VVFVGEVDDVVENRGGIEIAAQQNFTGSPCARHQQFTHGMTTFDLIATEGIVASTARAAVGLPGGGGAPLAGTGFAATTGLITIGCPASGTLGAT